jgi:putative oxidoreductase
MAAAGGALALGITPRPAVTVLAGSLVPTTLAGHRFWEQDDDAARLGQVIHFLKNLAIMGGPALCDIRRVSAWPFFPNQRQSVVAQFGKERRSRRAMKVWCAQTRLSKYPTS